MWIPCLAKSQGTLQVKSVDFFNSLTTHVYKNSLDL